MVSAEAAATITVCVEKGCGQRRQERLAPEGECRAPLHVAPIGISREAESVLSPSSSFLQSGETKLTAMSVYLIYARYPSHREDTTVQSCLHVLTHAACDFRWLGSTKPFLFQHTCDRVQGRPCYGWARHGDPAMGLVT